MNENRAEMHGFEELFSLTMKKEVFEKNTYLRILKIRCHNYCFFYLFLWIFACGMKERREEAPYNW